MDLLDETNFDENSCAQWKAVAVPVIVVRETAHGVVGHEDQLEAEASGGSSAFSNDGCRRVIISLSLNVQMKQICRDHAQSRVVTDSMCCLPACLRVRSSETWRFRSKRVTFIKTPVAEVSAKLNSEDHPCPSAGAYPCFPTSLYGHSKKQSEDVCSQNFIASCF